MAKEDIKQEDIKQDDMSYLDDISGMGKDKISYEDLPKPFLRILQQQSPQCVKGSDAYNPLAEPGMFMHSITGDIYGKKINVIMLHYEKIWVEWKPDRAGFVAQHKPDMFEVDKTNFKTWTRKDNGNIIEEYYNFYLLIEGHYHDGIAVFPLSSSGIKHARTWLGFIDTLKNPSGKETAMFGAIWELELVQDDKDGKKFYMVGYLKGRTAISKVRYVTKEEILDNIMPSLKLIETMSKELDYSAIESKESKQIEYNDPWKDGVKEEVK
jgi:hypothetical protein